MRRSLIVGIAWTGVAVLLALLVYAGVRVTLIRTDQVGIAERDFQVVRLELSQAHLAERSFETDLFQATARGAMSRNPRLEVLAIYSGSAVEYLLARRGRVDPDSASILIGGRPVIESSSLLDTVLVDPFSPPGRQPDRPLVITAVYRTLSRLDLATVLREVLTATVAYLLIVACILAIAAIARPAVDDPAASPRHRARADDEPSRPAVRSPSSAPSQKADADVPAERAATPRQDRRDSRRERLETDRAGEDPIEGTVFGDDRTGGDLRGAPIVSRGLLARRLESELQRAGSFDLSLAFALIAFDRDDVTDAVYRRGAEMVREVSAFPDLVYACGPVGYALILPEVDLDAALSFLEGLRSNISADDAIEGRTVSVGLTERAGRLLSNDQVFKEAQTALTRSRREGGNRVTAYRADPVRYRAGFTGG